jgi:4-aminobutyrate aminotransferase-like enzyme
MANAPRSGPPTMVNGFDPASAASLPEHIRVQVERRERLLGPTYRLFYATPVEVVRAQGVHLYDPEGHEYLDAYNNVPCVGHCHPRVTDAVARQMATLNTNTRYIQDSILAYSEQLLATFPAELGNITYTCTGSEANDLAMRVARYYTGHDGIIVTANAYHGLTTAVAEFSPSLGPHVRTIDAPDELRLPSGQTMAGHMRAQVRSAIADLERHGIRLRAFIADSIFSSDRVYAHPAGFLQPVVEEVHRAGSTSPTRYSPDSAAMGTGGGASGGTESCRTS